MMGLSGRPRKKFDDIFSHLDANTNMTDGRTNTGRQQRPRLRIASRGKKDCRVCIFGSRVTVMRAGFFGSKTSKVKVNDRAR